MTTSRVDTVSIPYGFTRVLFTALVALACIIAAYASEANAYISASPGSIYFFDEEVGGIGSSRSVSISNNSNQPVRGLSVYDNCFSDFNVSNYGCYGTLPAYGSCSLNVRFQPRMEGSHSCSIQISGAGSYASISISGRGVARDRALTADDGPDDGGDTNTAADKAALTEDESPRTWKQILPE